MAAQDAFIVPFAQASVEKQQSMIDEQPAGELRDSAIATRDGQVQAFAQDAFAAGTTLYKEVGPHVPIDDVEGRVRQARQIAQLRGGIPVMPFTGAEIAGMRRTLASGSEAEKQAIHTLTEALPADMRAEVEVRLTPPQRSNAPATAGSTNTMRIDAAPGREIDEPSGAGANSRPVETATTTEGVDGFGGAPQNGPVPGGPEYQAADADARRIVADQEKPVAGPSIGGQGDFTGTEPAPGSDVYRIAEAQARSEPVRDRVITDRMISEWASKAQPGSQMPPELVERLDPDEKQKIGDLVSVKAAIASDPAVLAEIVNGLKSRNPPEQRQWAQVPLYKYKSQLSANDFHKVVDLQKDLDPVSGDPRSEIAAIRKRLANRPDTSDLDGFYKALAPDPDVEYSEHWPFGAESSGKIRWFVLSNSARRFLKGVLDLLKGTKTGELTPEAVQAFTALNGGTSQIFGPAGDGATFAAGGKRLLSEAERKRAAETLAKNKITGRQFEKKSEAELREQGLEAAGQVTIRLPEGDRMVADILTRDPKTGKLGCKECKAGEKPTYKPAQRDKHRRFGIGGGTVAGEGRSEFPGGTKLAPTAVEIIRDR